MLKNKWFWFGVVFTLVTVAGMQWAVRYAANHPKSAASQALVFGYRIANPLDARFLPKVNTPVMPERDESRARPNTLPAEKPVNVAPVNVAPVLPARVTTEIVEVVEPITVEPPVASGRGAPVRDGLEESEIALETHPVQTPAETPRRMPTAAESEAACADLNCWTGCMLFRTLFDVVAREALEKVRHPVAVPEDAGTEESEDPQPPVDHYHPPHCPGAGHCPAPWHYRHLEIPASRRVMPPANEPRK